MNTLVTQSVMQLIIWGIGIFELILSLYILALNSRNSANRHSSALFFLFAINSFALGWLFGAKTTAEGYLPAAILAATTPIFGLALLLTSVVLIKPQWISSRFRWVWYFVYSLLALPFLITIIDLFFQTNLWFTGLSPVDYSGGYVSLSTYTNPQLSVLRIASLSILPMVAIIPLVYFAFFDKELKSSRRNLARVLLIGQIGATIFQIFFGDLLAPPLPTVFTNLIFFLVYAYATFSQSISERRLQRGRLQTRLTAAILAISLPLIVFVPGYLFSQTSTQVHQNSVNRLEQTSVSLASTVDTWLNSQYQITRVIGCAAWHKIHGSENPETNSCVDG